MTPCNAPRKGSAWLMPDAPSSRTTTGSTTGRRAGLRGTRHTCTCFTSFGAGRRANDTAALADAGDAQAGGLPAFKAQQWTVPL